MDAVEVEVVEVGLRDGLQNLDMVMATADKCRWIAAEHAAGVREIEVGSFVPPKLLPQMADAAEVVAFARTLRGLSVAALVPNLRGARDAIIAAKRAELDWCDAELRLSRAAPQAPGIRALSDLVAWRGLIAAVQEWPLDAPTLRRFVLYLAIPLGSWLGGAFVDHVVDRLLR